MYNYSVDQLIDDLVGAKIDKMTPPIKGIYKNGSIRLIEPLPKNLKSQKEILVTLVEEEDNLQELSEGQQAALALSGMMSDLSEDQLAQFDQILREKRSFTGPREVKW